MHSKRLAVAVLFSAFAAQAAYGEVVNSDVQCWAKGHSLRINGSEGTDQTVDSRLALDFASQKDGSIVLRGYVGHVGVTFQWNDANNPLVDYYGIYVGKDHLASLSPRARVYRDAEYVRFNDFDAATTTSHDGGGLWGTLVVSKQALTDTDETFDAHYIVQGGDHFGGTIDYTCQRER